MKKLLISILVFTPLFAISQLTGYWQSDVGGCYQIRQDGNEVWMIGERGANIRASIVFHGVLAGNILTGQWCDMPSHDRQNCGEGLSLRVENNNRMVKIGETASYAGTVWTRGACIVASTSEIWDVTGAGGWTAIWTRRSNSNTFDGVWTGPQGQKGYTVIEITIIGTQMRGKRIQSSDNILCDFQGTVSSDGKSVSGSGSCTTGPAWNWSARIRK